MPEISAVSGHPGQALHIIYPRVLSDAAVTNVEDDAGTLNVTKENGLALLLVTI